MTPKDPVSETVDLRRFQTTGLYVTGLSIVHIFLYMCKEDDECER